MRCAASDGAPLPCCPLLPSLCRNRHRFGTSAPVWWVRAASPPCHLVLPATAIAVAGARTVILLCLDRACAWFLAQTFAEVKDLAVRYLLVEFVLESAPQILIQVRHNSQRYLGVGGVPSAMVMTSDSLLLLPRPSLGPMAVCVPQWLTTDCFSHVMCKGAEQPASRRGLVGSWYCLAGTLVRRRGQHTLQGVWRERRILHACGARASAVHMHAAFAWCAVHCPHPHCMAQTKRYTCPCTAVRRSLALWPR